MEPAPTLFGVEAEAIRVSRSPETQGVSWGDEAGQQKTRPKPGPELAMVRARGLEPPWGCPHTDLNRTRLPIPPRPHVRCASCEARKHVTALIRRAQEGIFTRNDATCGGRYTRREACVKQRGMRRAACVKQRGVWRATCAKQCAARRTACAPHDRRRAQQATQRTRSTAFGTTGITHSRRLSAPAARATIASAHPRHGPQHEPTRGAAPSVRGVRATLRRRARRACAL